MFDDLIARWFSPWNIEIATRDKHPNDTNPRESEKGTFDEDADEDADRHH